MVTKSKSGKSSKKRRSSSFERAVLGKPSGIIMPRVKAVGPEHFGVLSVDCAKDRSKWMLCDFYGQIHIPPTVVQHVRSDLQLTVHKVQQSVAEHALKDVIVCIEMTGTYHHLIWRTFRDAGFETRLVHPFASNHYRAPENGDIKTDDNDLIAIFRAAVNGFGLIEQPWSQRDQSIKLLARHRRDLVKKRAKLQCQIRHRLESCLPGYAGLFPDKDLWDHPVGLMVLQFIADRGGTHRALLDEGIPGVTKWLKNRGCLFRSRSVERIVAWAANAASGDPMNPLLTRIWLSLLADWRQKSEQIHCIERDLASLLAQTPWILLLSHPGINVVSAAELAGETGPIEHYASAKAITGRAGLFPSRYQSDNVDRGGNLSRFRNGKMRSAWLLVADNLIKCNEYWRGKYQFWKSQGHDPRELRCRIANRITRTVYQMVAGKKLFQHASRLNRGYVLQKLLEFHRNHQTTMDIVLADLNAATDQLPKSAYTDEAKPLYDIRSTTVRSRKKEPQQLGSILVQVLMRLGVTTEPPTINSKSLEAPVAESSEGDR
jgi:transposase